MTVSDLERDFSAVMESYSDIKAAYPLRSWPDGLTLEKNLIDLAWHQKEFESRRSFAWVIEDRHGAYMGCLYIYPSIAGEDSAEVHWWWRTGAKANKDEFRKDLLAWISGPDWPVLDYRLSN